MKVLRININDLKMNNMKLGMKSIDLFASKMIYILMDIYIK